MIRKEKIVNKLRLNGKGLEIGPLCWPVITKAESSISYVDHASTEDLKIKYAEEGFAVDQIVEVDYVLGDKSLGEVVGRSIKFDYIIASHVIEHIPDIVRWMQDMSSVLKAGGKLSLAIPDRRFTFDIDRHESRPADIIGAYLDEYKTTSSTMLFDFASEYRQNVDAKKVWGGESYTNIKSAPKRYSLKEVLAMCAESKSGKYVDTHCFVFTPYSFFASIKKLIEVGVFDFRVSSFYNTAPGEYEFFVTFEKISRLQKKGMLSSLPKLPQPLSERELEKIIRDQKQEIANLKAEGLKILTELDNTLSSKSWRSTKHLRKISSVISRLRR